MEREYYNDCKECNNPFLAVGKQYYCVECFVDVRKRIEHDTEALGLGGLLA